MYESTTFNVLWLQPLLPAQAQNLSLGALVIGSDVIRIQMSKIILCC